MLCVHSSPVGDLGTENTGGMSVVVREISRQLGLLGHQVDIFTAAAYGREATVFYVHENVRLVHINQRTDSSPSKAEMFHHLPRYYKAMDAFKRDTGARYDLLHSHYWLSGRMGHWAQDSWALPHVITYHTLGLLKNHFGPYMDEPDLRMAWERRLSRSCHRVLVPTRQEKEALIENSDVEGSKVGIVPFGVDIERFSIHDALEARRRLGLEVGELLVLFIGRFVPIKGIERLLEAISKFEKTDNLRLLLIGGDGPNAESTQELKHLACRMGIWDRVTFIGRVGYTELGDYYNASDVLVLPSFYESFGLVTLESMACGTPVVATPVGVVDSIVENGKNGSIVDDQTATGISESLRRVFRWIKHGKMSRSRVRASVLNYAWHHVAQSLLNEYEQTIDAHLETGATHKGCEI